MGESGWEQTNPDGLDRMSPRRGRGESHRDKGYCNTDIFDSFLEQNQCIINAEQHTIHLQGKAVAISGGGARKSCSVVNPSVQLVVPDQLTPIPPLSEMETMASTLGQHNCDNHHTYLVEATANDRPSIIVANAIVSPQVATTVVSQLCPYDMPTRRHIPSRSIGALR